MPWGTWVPGRLCLPESHWVHLALLISQEGSPGEARLKREWPWGVGDVSPPQPLPTSSLRAFYILGDVKSQKLQVLEDHPSPARHFPPHFPSLYSSPEGPQGTQGMPRFRER